MSTRDVKLQLVIGALDQASSQLKQIDAGVEALGSESAKTQDVWRELDASAVQLAGSLKGAEAAQHKLALAQYDAQKAAARLADAQDELRDNTDPERQGELAEKVLRAQVAFDRADDKARALSSAVRDLGDKTAATGMKWTEFKSQLDVGIGVAKQAFEVGKQVMEETVGTTMAYAKEVRDLGRSIGATAEETSALIQAADDMMVSTETLERGLIGAVRKGFRPTIEGVGELSDQYLAIQDPIARTKFLIDTFGKAGADLAPLMEQGSAGIREMGEEARELGLILSEEDVVATRELEKEMDNAGDRVEGLKLKVGKGLVPALVSYLGAVDDAAGGTGDWTDGMRAAFPVLNFLWRETKQEAEATEAAARGTATFGGAILNAANAGGQFAVPLDLVNVKLREQKAEVDLATAAMDSLRTSMAGAIDGELADFQTKEAEISIALDEHKAKIDELAGRKYLTSAQQEELATLRQEYEDLETAYGAEADAHGERTKKILFDLTAQALAANAITGPGGEALTADEAAFLDDLAGKWGLVGEKTFAAQQKVNDLVSNVTSPDQLPGLIDQLTYVAEHTDGTDKSLGAALLTANEKANDLIRDMQALDGAEFTVTISRGPGGGGGQPVTPSPSGAPQYRQHGGDLWPGGRFIVGEGGVPEMIEMWPSGFGATATPMGGSGGGRGAAVVYSPTYNINGSTLTPALFMKILREHDREAAEVIFARGGRA